MAEERLVYFSKVSLDSKDVYEITDDYNRKLRMVL